MFCWRYCFRATFASIFLLGIFLFLKLSPHSTPETPEQPYLEIRQSASLQVELVASENNSDSTGVTDQQNCQNDVEYERFIEDLKKEKLIPSKSNLGATGFYTYKNNNKLGYCVNLKSGYTLLTLIFGYLTDSRRCNIETKWTEKLVEKCNKLKYRKTTVSKTKAIKNAWTILTLIRDPINRFLSGWLDRCVHRRWRTKTDYCTKCKQDIGCFVKMHYQKLLGYSNGTNKIGATFDGGHFWPQNWICPLYPKLNTVLIKLGRDRGFFERLKSALGEHGVPQAKLIRIMKAVELQTTAHTRFGGEEWKKAVEAIRKDDDIYRTLLKIYYFDYENFGIFKIRPTLQCWLDSNEEILRK